MLFYIISDIHIGDVLMKIKEYLGDRAFYRNTAVIAIPIALQSLITIGVNLVDNIMLGSLGEVPLSASALAVSFISFYNICCMGLGMGASVLVSRFWGMKDLDSLRKTITLYASFHGRHRACIYYSCYSCTVLNHVHVF